MEVLKSFLIIIVVVLSFGVAIIAGQNGLLSARCAARCLTEHKDRLKGSRDRNSHRKFKLLDKCKNDKLCYECMKPCAMPVRELVDKKCNICEDGEQVCEKSCDNYIHTTKAGDCPSPDSAIGFEAVCLVACQIDSDCDDNKRCCPNTCGYTCRKPDYNSYDLPPVPTNVSFEEKRQGKSLKVTWLSQETESSLATGLYVIEVRNTTNLMPTFDDNSPWTILSVTMSVSTWVQQVHAGHYYQFRVAMVTDDGTQGFSSISSPFKSSRIVQHPLPPQNLTEGNTTFKKSYVDLTIHWQPPKYSDIPVWKYLISWREIVTKSSPVIIRIAVLEKKVLGNVHEMKLKRLKPGTSYNIQIGAIVRYGNRELRSEKTSLRVKTYAPPNYSNNKRAAMKGIKSTFKDHVISDSKENTVSVYKDIIRVKKLKVVDDLSYFDRGSLKAKLTWTVGKDFRSVVKSYMIYWKPEECSQDLEMPHLYDATSIVTEFEVYDLQYECKYTIKVNAVTKAGVQGKQTTIRLRTPQCEKISVKGDSLPPECPAREPQVPNKPRRVRPVVMKDNCSISVNLTWKHPRSDMPIESYLIEYQLTDSSRKKALNTVGRVYKPKPIQIDIDKVKWYTIVNLNQSETYLVKIYAISEIGRGKPAFIEILTPRIFPCGSDKDPEPPDGISQITQQTPHSTTVLSTVIKTALNVTTLEPLSITTLPDYTENFDNASDLSERPNIDIYRTLYYLAIFISKLFAS